MKHLTIEQLNNLNPENIYDLPLCLNKDLWKKIKLPIKLPKPVRFQFDEKIREKLPATIKNGKGIYMFFVEPNHTCIPSISILHLVYIGKVVKTNTFFKRFYDYVSAIGKIDKRRNIQLLTNLWPEHTYVYYFNISGTDSQIEKIETMLIDHIIPPLNNRFYLKEAQNTRSIYN